MPRNDILTERCPVCNGMPDSYTMIGTTYRTFMITCPDFVSVKSSRSRKHAVALWNQRVKQALAMKRKAEGV